MSERIYYDIGEEKPLMASSTKTLAKILEALVLCGGQLHDTHSLEISNGVWRYSKRSCAIVLRISLPSGYGIQGHFEEVSGVKLTRPPQISGSAGGN